MKLVFCFPDKADPFEYHPEHSGREPYQVCLRKLHEIYNPLDIYVNHSHIRADIILTIDGNLSHKLGSLLNYLALFILKKIFNKRLILILWEPPCISPDTYRKNLKKYDVILTLDNSLLYNPSVPALEYHWPQYFHHRGYCEEQRSRRVVSFFGNKKSKCRPNGYDLRFDTMTFLQAEYSEHFDLYGPGWEGSIFESMWHGFAADQHDVAQGYDFALVIENEIRSDKYITEKLFNALQAGCIVIYYGGGKLESYINDEVVIFPERAELTDKSFWDGIFQMSEVEVMQRRGKIRNLLRSLEDSDFNPVNFADKIIRAIELCHR